MAVLVRILDRESNNLSVVRSAISRDPDLELDATVADVRSLAGCEIGIVNMDALSPSDLERMRLLGAPPGVTLISVSTNADRLEIVRPKSIALLSAPSTAADTIRALAAAKDVVLVARMESLSSLLTAYRSDNEDSTTSAREIPRAEAIDWIESDGNYIKIHADDGCHTLRMTMLQAEEAFRDTPVMRVHRKWLVNTSRICDIRGESDGAMHIVLASGQELAVGRAYRSAIRRHLNMPADAVAHYAD